MKRILFFTTLLFLFSCTNSRLMQKKELANAIKKNKIEVYENNEGNLNFFIEESNGKFQYQAKIPLEDKDFYDISIKKLQTKISTLENQMKTTKYTTNWYKNALLKLNSYKYLLILIEWRK